MFRRVADSLWENLEMETMPFDVRVEGTGERAALYIETKKIASQREVPPGTEDLSALREGILAALNEARKKHPMANFFKF
jgi:hypothetical protein